MDLLIKSILNNVGLECIDCSWRSLFSSRVLSLQFLFASSKSNPTVHVMQAEKQNSTCYASRAAAKVNSPIPVPPLDPWLVCKKRLDQ